MKETFRPVNIGTLTSRLETRADGSMLVHALQNLHNVPEKLTERLEFWAKTTPNRTFIAERISPTEGWRKLSYGETWDRVRAIATSLLQRNLTPETPIAILSGNDIDQALLGLAAMVVGIPFSPISPAYSLISSDYGKLKHIIGQLTPAIVFANNAKAFGKAINAVIPAGIEVIISKGEIEGRKTSTFSRLIGAIDERAVAAAHKKITPDTIAKILYTSGSTGMPKGVINTQRMLCANQAMLAHTMAFVKETPPILVDWLPWSHTFGGNHNFGLVLNNGGTLYIDEGKPTPQGFAETLRNLREISPTLYFNVPKGYESLVAALEKEPALRTNFFKDLRLTFYAGAGLPPHIAQALQQQAIAALGQKVLMVTSLGSTETAPAALFSTPETARPGVVGVPLPDVTLKLIPNAGKLELRLKGPNITPGYWRDATQSKKAFDEEGFYILGDALRFAEAGNPNAGFIFDGRVAEDFKLITGTWVSVGTLRLALVSALTPFVKDAVIAGHDKNDVTAMLFPDFEACAGLAGTTPLSPSEILAHPAVEAALQQKLQAFANESTGSSTKVMRITLLEELPSIDAGEITDKGALNQRAVLTNRAEFVEALYAARPQKRIITL